MKQHRSIQSSRPYSNSFCFASRQDSHDPVIFSTKGATILQPSPLDWAQEFSTFGAKKISAHQITPWCEKIIEFVSS